MRFDYVPGKNSEGYPDPTAATALANIELERKYRGMRSRVAGNHFEELITASLQWYEDKGIACIEKTPEPMKPVSKPNKKGQFLACYTKAGQPDYKGTIDGGRSVVFEAKHTDGDRIEYSRLTPEQVKKLTFHHKLGAVAFVLVSIGVDGIYRIPWTVWRDMKTLYGRKYMTKVECDPYRVQYISGVIKLLEGITTEEYIANHTIGGKP